MRIIKTLAPKNTTRLVLLLTLTLIIFTVLIPLYHPFVTPLVISFKAFSALSSSSPSSSFSSPSDHIINPGSSSDSDNIVVMKSLEAESYNCDVFTGEWVPNPEAPYYTNTTCWAIHDHQNCMKYGRPDTGFMKWKWKPDGCELPVLNPYVFLELLRGKKLAFVGDSIGRNQMQSLICLLSRVTYPDDVSYTPDEKFKRWLYKDYNFTIASFWSPFLVRSKEADPNGPTLTGLFNLYLDEFDKDWTTQIDEFDYVIISAGHWFFRPAIFYEKGRIVGCHFCQQNNLTDLTKYYGYRKAFRTALRALYSSESFKGVTYLRTFSPSHFEGGMWNEGGDCLRRKPFLSNETRLDGYNLELYMIQVEEFRAAEKKARERDLRLRLLDTTLATLLRPDGHPSRYGHWPHENVTLYHDCVHWCLPGPIDTWNDFLLHMLKVEGSRSYHESRQLQKSDRKLKVL